MNATDAKKIISQYAGVFPVPVGTIAQALGIKVYTTLDLPPNTSGSIVKEDNDQFTIYVKEGQSPRRQRFTIAHEIGHFVQHSDELAEGEEMVSPVTKKAVVAMHRPDDSKSMSEDVKGREQEADQFAADLLMPKEEFEKIWIASNTLQEVADYFGVSQMAANVRALLLNLGYFDESILA